MKSLKVVVVGDGAVGKSCLLITATSHSFPAEYVPTVFDNYSTSIMTPWDKEPVNIAFFDTAGQEDYDRLRPLSYPLTDVFLLCFSVCTRASLENITEKWLPEIHHFCPHTPIIIVACKTDLRASHPTVSYDEGSKFAKKCGLHYLETSSLRREGLQECFNLAVQVGCEWNLIQKKKTKGGFFHIGSGKNKKTIPLPPVMPPAGFAPTIEVQTSTFADEWYGMLQNPSHTDVTFILESGAHRLDAHKVILCGASKFFRKLFNISALVKNNQLKQINGNRDLTNTEINEGKLPGVSAVYQEPSKNGTHGSHTSSYLTNDKNDVSAKGASRTVVEISADIQAASFVHLLEFLYTGTPRISDDAPDEKWRELQRVAGIYGCKELGTICYNCLTEQEFLNPSIGTYLNDETGAKLKELFFCQPTLSDIVFNVEGTKIYAHKVVLCARCEVMAAMFSGSFLELSEMNLPDTPLDDFLALLEYLYTDHAPIEDGDSVGIMIHANMYCQPRLVNLCELYISKEVERACSEKIEKSDIDVIGILNNAKDYNAAQLVDFCLHFISSNYQAFSQRNEFSDLSPTDLDHVEEHQWPPKEYLRNVEIYERTVAKIDGQKCAIM